MYRYVNELREMEIAPDQKGTTKGLFFSKINTHDLKESASPQRFSKQPIVVGRGSLAPIQVNKIDRSQVPRSVIVNKIVKNTGGDNFQNGNLTKIGDIQARMTLLKVTAKESILQNVNSEEISEDEQVIFKRVSTMLEKHLSERSNLFSILFNEFQIYVITKYDAMINDIKNRVKEGKYDEKSVNYFNAVLDNLCKEILEFIHLQVKCLILFYNFDICYFRVHDKETHQVSYLPCTILNFDHLMNFTTAIMFPKKIYLLVVEYFLFKNGEKIERLKHNMDHLQDVITMDSLEVIDKFQLRRQESTVIRQVVNVPSHYTEEINESPSARNTDQRMSNERQVKASELKKQNTLSVSLQQLTVSPDISDDPYLSAIMALKLIDEVDSPLEKMKVLLTVIRKIMKCINDYHARSSGKKEVLTGDQTMALVVYIVMKSRCAKLSAYVEYIETFMPPRMFGTFCGYYLTVFQAACEFIAEHQGASS